MILAGGTMKPNASLVDQLLAYGESNQKYHRDRIYEFSCGHVIDGATQLLPAVLSHGPSRQKFDFTYSNRNNTKLVSSMLKLNESNYLCVFRCTLIC